MRKAASLLYHGFRSRRCGRSARLDWGILALLAPALNPFSLRAVLIVPARRGPRQW